VTSSVLSTLGIDLDEVRVSVRATFGAGALDRLAQRRAHQPWQPWQPWRRPNRGGASLLAGTQGVAPRLKQALEHAAQAVGRVEGQLIEPVTLLLSVLEVEDALANRLLDDLGVRPSDLRAATH
jgi:hypothetical protein